MAQVNEKAPELTVDQWVQGNPTSIEQERGRVLLIEVFQVNCPGCFIAGIPEIIDLLQTYQDEPLTVWGLATAFEDFDKNNLENLKKLVHKGEVIGETLSSLSTANMLNGNKLLYPIPFPVAWDKLDKNSEEINEEDVQKIIRRDINNFDALPEKNQNMVRAQVAAYLRQKQYDAKTFEAYELRGTPSTLIIDKKGVLRHKLFGSGLGLAKMIQPLLAE